MPALVLEQLAALEGYLTTSEGQRLAELAMSVRTEHAIVEVGSFKGKSTCYLGVGSRLGARAPVFAIDLWELHPSDRYSSPEVFRKWREQIAAMNLEGLVTPIRCESGALGPRFSQPIGLLFIDGNHGYESVARDFFAWSPNIVPGGVVAFHDYRKPQVGEGVTRFVEETLSASEGWVLEDTVDSLLIARRRELPDASREGLTFVENQELEQHLAKRPPQYGLDLSLVVPQRNSEGIFVDTHSPHYGPLLERYRDFKVPPKPLEARVETLCKACPVGARCQFPRLPLKDRKQILESNDPVVYDGWCETKAWGGETDVVYFYVAAPARGEELRISLRSLEKHFVGTPRVWVVGDRPEWYQGNHIPHERVPPCSHRPRFDHAAKLWKVLRERRIADEFLWMMDDIYFLLPMTIEELRTPVMQGRFHKGKLKTLNPQDDWQRAKYLTWERLAQDGYPVDDAATHTPRVFEKPKVRRMLKEYRLDKNPYVFDLLYANLFATVLPKPSRSILHRDPGTGAADAIRDRLKSALILNHPDEGYTPAMEEVLYELFPEPSRYERP